MLQYLFFWLIRAQMGHYHQTWVFVALLGQCDIQQLSKTDKQPEQHIQQSWFMTAFYKERQLLATTKTMIKHV